MRGYTQCQVWHPDFGFTCVREPWPHLFDLRIKPKDLEAYVEKSRQCLKDAAVEGCIPPTWDSAYCVTLDVKLKQTTRGNRDFPCGCVSTCRMTFRPGDLWWAGMPDDIRRNKMGRR